MKSEILNIEYRLANNEVKNRRMSGGCSLESKAGGLNPNTIPLQERRIEKDFFL